MTIANGYHTAFVDGIGCAVIFRNGQDVHLVKRMDHQIEADKLARSMQEDLDATSEEDLRAAADRYDKLPL